MDPIVGFIVLLASTLFLYAVFTLLRKWADSFVILSFGLASLVNATIFTYANAPVEIGKFVFAMDSVLYTLFAYAIALKYIHYSFKDTKMMILSATISIVLSAIIKLLAMSASTGFTWNNFSNFFKSLTASAAAIISVLIELLILRGFKKKKWNMILALALGILVCSVLNSALYYTVSCFALKNPIPENLLKVILGSWILKFVCVGLSTLCYFINLRFWVPNELKKREEQNNNNQANLQ